WSSPSYPPPPHGAAARSLRARLRRDVVLDLLGEELEIVEARLDQSIHLVDVGKLLVEREEVPHVRERLEAVRERLLDDLVLRDDVEDVVVRLRLLQAERADEVDTSAETQIDGLREVPLCERVQVWLRAKLFARDATEATEQ